MTDKQQNTVIIERTRSLVEEPCLTYIYRALQRHGRTESARELAEDIKKLVTPGIPNDYLSLHLSPPPGFERAGKIRLGFALGSSPFGQVQRVPVGSEQELIAVFERKNLLLVYAAQWFRAFAAGSPGLAEQIAEVLGESEWCIRQTEDKLGLVLCAGEKTEMLAPVVFLVNLDGTVNYLPAESIQLESAPQQQ